MEACADLDPERLHPLGDRLRASHCTARPIERREETVAHLADLSPVEPSQLRTDDRVVAILHLPSALVAEARTLGRGVDDVREQPRRDLSVERSFFIPDRCEERSDGAPQLVDV